MSRQQQRRRSHVVVAVVTAIGVLAGCGGDEEPPAASDSPKILPDYLYDCGWSSEVGQYTCKPSGFEDNAARQLARELTPEDLERTVHYRPAELLDFDADQFEQLQKTLASDEFILANDEDLLRQLRTWGTSNGVHPSVIDDVVKAPKVVPTRCRLARGPFHIRVLVCT